MKQEVSIQKLPQEILRTFLILGIPPQLLHLYFFLTDAPYRVVSVDSSPAAMIFIYIATIVIVFKLEKYGLLTRPEILDSEGKKLKKNSLGKRISLRNIKVSGQEGKKWLYIYASILISLILLNIDNLINIITYLLETL